MKRLQDLVNDAVTFVIKNKFTFIPSFIFILIILIYIFNSSTQTITIFFTDAKKTYLYSEKRVVAKGKNRLDKLNKIVDEVLLGPANENYINLFSENSRIVSSWIEKDQISINFSKETIIDLDNDKKSSVSTSFLALQSIIFSIYKNDSSIKNIKFYFDGVEYRFVDNFNLSENNFKINWKKLKK